MNFFNTISTIGTLQSKRPSSIRNTDPVKHARSLFATGVQKQLAGIDADEIGKPGSWIARDGDKFLVSLRYKLVPMKLDGQNAWLRVDSIELVKDVLVRAKAACAEGQFDQIFLNTGRKSKKEAA